jgi:hypothetical protein
MNGKFLFRNVDVRKGHAAVGILLTRIMGFITVKDRLPGELHFCEERVRFGIQRMGRILAVVAVPVS